MDFPRRIAPALAIPKQATVPKFRATTTTALAATISLPRCPIMTEYIENASPQETSLPKAGREYFIKSANKTLFRSKMAAGRNRITLKWRASSIQIPNSMPLAMVVARATPAIPILGAPKRPKINTALRKMFKSRADALAAVAKITRSMVRMVHR